MGNLQVFLLTIFFRFLSVQATKKAESYLDSAVKHLFLVSFLLSEYKVISSIV